MKRIILALSIACLLGCERGPDARIMALEKIRSYRDKDLEKLPEVEAEALKAAITTVVPNRDYQRHFDFRPWRIWESPNEPIVLFEANTQPHPGSSEIRITAIDKSGRVQSETIFDTGNRCYLSGVTLEKPNADRRPLIVLETHGEVGDPRQYYGRIGARFDLVRLQDSDGKAARNDYHVNHYMCGPDMPRQSQAEWEADVLSTDRLRILRALTWLGGRHGEIQQGDPPKAEHEDFEQIQLVLKVRSSPPVQARLKEMAKSEDAWIREAALLALEPKDARW